MSGHREAGDQSRGKVETDGATAPSTSQPRETPANPRHSTGGLWVYAYGLVVIMLMAGLMIAAFG